MGANDISRWCTVWSLLERGTYVIDECPWQADTQDKVFRAPKGRHSSAAGERAGPALLLEQARFVADIDRRDSLSGAGCDRRTARPGGAPEARATVDPEAGPRLARTASKAVLETPKDPVRWPAYIFYFKPIVVLLNVIPFGIF